MGNRDSKIKKWEIWYSWYYEDVRAHVGSDSFEFESEKKPSKKELLRYMAENGLSPCGIEYISIDNIIPVAKYSELWNEIVEQSIDLIDDNHPDWCGCKQCGGAG